METKIQNIGKIGSTKLYFDPLRKEDSFLLLMKNNEIKMGFIVNDGIVLESNSDVKWEDVLSVVGGFSLLETFQKIKETVDEKNR